MPKNYQKQAEAQKEYVINPENINFNQFLTQKMLMLSNTLRINWSRP